MRKITKLIRLSHPVIMLLSAVLLNGCARPLPSVIKESSQIIKDERGRGFIISEAALSDLLKCCNQQTRPEK